MNLMQHRSIIDYFNATAWDYKTFWSSKDDLAMHFGYWDSSVHTHRQSLLKMNEILARAANIQAGEKILDAGCGFGGSVFWLRKNYHGDVYGISVVAREIAEAQDIQNKYNIDKVHFSVADCCRTPYPDQFFDVIWALESIVHVQDKQSFINEAYRLLKPGGRLIIAEYMLRDEPPLSDKELSVIQPWINGWAMSNLLTTVNYSKLLNSAGFNNVRFRNITDQITRSVGHLGKTMLPTLPTAMLIYPFLQVCNWLGLYNTIRAGIYQSKALKQRLWQYQIMIAQKYDT